MNWVVQLYAKLYPWCIQPPNRTHFGHIGGVYERIMAYAVGEQNVPHKKIKCYHNHYYKSLCY
jgi:hypothetical protein